VTGSQPTDVLPGKATGAPAEAPTEAPATNNIQKMPVKLCKLITQSHGNSWPSLRDLSGIVTTCAFFMTFSVCSIKLVIFGNCGAMCLGGISGRNANYYSGISKVVAFFKKNTKKQLVGSLCQFSLVGLNVQHRLNDLLNILYKIYIFV
jgi:hypothetical protein